LILFHCKSNAGYAIGRLEPVFFEMARRLTGNVDKIHLAYSGLSGGRPAFVDEDFVNVIEFDTADERGQNLDAYDYIRKNKIDIVFGFDQPVSRPTYSLLRHAGIRLFASYWGAPMSVLNRGVKLQLKKMEVKLRRNKPDHFIFESRAMADTAVFGRGIKSNQVSVTYLVVDTNKFKPDFLSKAYVREVFSIPEDRKIILYSGHMEERKGVRVIIEAANELVLRRKRKDVQFLLLGNRKGEETNFGDLYIGSETEKYIMFGGYHDDINKIIASCDLGVIASTGWDSFTMSSIEMASTGLPLVVSNLQGLVETIDNGTERVNENETP